MNVKWTFRVLLSRQSLYSLACKLFVDNKQGMNCKEKTDNGNKIFVLKVFFVEYKGSYKKTFCLHRSVVAPQQVMSNTFKIRKNFNCMTLNGIKWILNISSYPVQPPSFPLVMHHCTVRTIKVVVFLKIIPVRITDVISQSYVNDGSTSGFSLKYLWISNSIP